MSKKTYNSKYSKTLMLIKLRRHLLPMYEVVKIFRELELNFAPNETCNVDDFDKLHKALAALEEAWLEVKEQNK